MQLGHRIREPRPFVVLQPPGAQLVLVDLPDRAQHPHGELRRAHFHAEHRHRQAVVHGGVLGDVEGEGGLAHAGAAGDDDQVTRLQPGGAVVEVVEAGGHAGDVGSVALVVEVVDLLEHARQHRLDVLQAVLAPRARLGDLEDARLGLVEELRDLLALRVVGAVGDLARHLREAPLHRALAHQFGVAADVGGAGGGLRQGRQVGGAAGAVLVLARLDRLAHRHDVGGTVQLDQARDVAEDAAVVVAIEVLRADHVGDAVEGLVVEEQAAEQRLLRLHRMRRDLQRQELRIAALLARCRLCKRHLVLFSPAAKISHARRKIQSGRKTGRVIHTTRFCAQ